ncbi:phosphate acyltransferase, partial [Rhizobium ruizarguesonis]
RHDQRLVGHLRQQLRLQYAGGGKAEEDVGAAKAAERKRVIFSEGEDERVLRAAQVLLEEGIAEPILIGRPQVIETRLKRYGL